MLKHVKALAIKLVSIFVIVWAILGGIYGLSIGDILTIVIAFGLIEYIIGDMIVLRYTNNTIGTIGDFGLALLIIWFIARNTIDNLLSAVVFASIAISIYEYFFHKYVYRNIFEFDHSNKSQSPRNYRYQIETSKEFSDMKRKKD